MRHCSDMKFLLNLLLRISRQTQLFSLKMSFHVREIDILSSHILNSITHNNQISGCTYINHRILQFWKFQQFQMSAKHLKMYTVKNHMESPKSANNSEFPMSANNLKFPMSANHSKSPMSANYSEFPMSSHTRNNFQCHPTVGISNVISHSKFPMSVNHSEFLMPANH